MSTDITLWVLGTITVLCGVLAVILACFLTFVFVDFMLGSSMKTSGIITEKKHYPAHNSSVLMLIGEVLVPMPQHVPDRYFVLVKGLDESWWAATDRQTWMTAEIGQKATVSFVVGRFSGTDWGTRIESLGAL